MPTHQSTQVTIPQGSPDAYIAQHDLFVVDGEVMSEFHAKTILRARHQMHPMESGLYLNQLRSIGLIRSAQG